MNVLPIKIKDDQTTVYQVIEINKLKDIELLNITGKDSKFIATEINFFITKGSK